MLEIGKFKIKMATVCNNKLSSVEQIMLNNSNYKLIYKPTEKIPSLITNNFPSMGKFTALRFIEWVQKNPEGIISLPTGKTPEFFIKSFQRYLKNWDKKEIISELASCGIDTSKKPQMNGLHFVQIDEFYPINSSQTNSFYSYVQDQYIKGFGLDPQKCMLIDSSRIGLTKDENVFSIWPEHKVDLSLRYRHAKTVLEQKQKDVLEKIDQWCDDYEQKIRSLGGIGFFLGGIGPDGHIGFNIKGSDHFSTTRLCNINYETQAAAATDLGGIETASKSLVVTIGLGTITYNSDCTAIIMAAGKAKAQIVADAVQSKAGIDNPATVLHKLANARFYLTKGAASNLIERKKVDFLRENNISSEDTETIISDVSNQNGKSLKQLSGKDLSSNTLSGIVLKKSKKQFKEIIDTVYNSFEKKISKGTQTLKNKTFLHTEPHHDDVMLGYFAQAVRNFRSASNSHYFMTFTSGFTSVTNNFVMHNIANLKGFLKNKEFISLFNNKYFKSNSHLLKNRDIWQYLDGVAANSEDMKNEGCARRFLRIINDIYKIINLSDVENKLSELSDYFKSQYPGKIDPKEIQTLKGMLREWEAECLWGYYGWNSENVMHMRLKFYTGDIFTPEPTINKDVVPIVNKLKKINPDIITVAFDPEGSGPDTHYKVLQAVAEALKIYLSKTKRKNIKIWGYRNVWYRFAPGEANIYVPVSLNMFAIMDQSFKNAFLSQKKASFPSYEYDGPFCELAQEIQAQQYQKIKTCLGRDWFHNHPSPLIRATRGLVFLKEMTPDEFYLSCRRLKKSMVNSDNI